MIKEIVQHTDPAAAKAMMSGIATVSVFGVSFNAEELSFWVAILADLGVFAGGVVTVILGIQSWRSSRNKNK